MFEIQVEYDRSLRDEASEPFFALLAQRNAREARVECMPTGNTSAEPLAEVLRVNDSEAASRIFDAIRSEIVRRHWKLGKQLKRLMICEIEPAKEMQVTTFGKLSSVAE